MTVVRVFAGANAAGNPCELIAARAPAAGRIERADTTRCFSWQWQTGSGRGPGQSTRVAVACYSPEGRGIQCCGHGLLAAGWYWLNQGLSAPLQLAMAGCSVDCVPDANKLWLHFNGLSSHPVAVPNWVQTVFESKPIGAATAGSDDGYLVLEWPRGFPLRTLPVPAPTLARHTRRAVIACCWPGGGTGMLHFRYFAPQYGVAEDTATGSAMRILMDYCRQRHQLDRVEAFQCSASGGMMSARVLGDKIAVGGSVECSQI